MRFFPIKLQLAFLMVLALPVSAFAASTITLTSSGNGVFQLQGANMENAAAIDVAISYDTATLATRRARSAGKSLR